MKIKNKFLYPIMNFVCVFFTIFGFFLSNKIYNLRIVQLNSFIFSIEQTLPNEMKTFVWNYDLELLENIANAVYQDNRIYSIKVYDEFENIIYFNEKNYKLKYGSLIKKEYPLSIKDNQIGKVETIFSTENLEKEYSFLLRKIAIFFLITILIIYLTINQISKFVVTPIIKIANYAKLLETGDFTKKINFKTSDELNYIIKSFNSTVDTLKEVFTLIDQGNKKILITSTDINNSNNQLSDNVNDQAASIEQTSTSMEMVHNIVLDNIEQTKKLNILTQNTKNEIANIERKSEVLLQSMEDIVNSSKKIKEIIKIIEDIAFQTNLLSLNAAVEAARASKSSKGFTVVSEKIRKLALKTSRAANDIKLLIQDSSETINKGQVFVVETSEKMNEIIEQTSKVASYIESINKMSDIELTGLTEVKNATHTLNQITQSNAELSQDTALVANKLQKQIENFSKSFDFFKMT